MGRQGQMIPLHVAIALSQVGVRESPKGSNRGPDVDKYTGCRAEPWCAHFVAWCFREASAELPGDVMPSPKRARAYASVSHTLRVFQEHGWFYNEPQVGDIVFYSKRGKSDAGSGKHIGIVVAVGPESFETVEGNWGDRVAKRVVDRDFPDIVGFGRRP